MLSHFFSAIRTLAIVFVIGNLCAMEVAVMPNAPVASHLEVALYRLGEAGNIERHKFACNTRLNAVAVLLNLEAALDVGQIDQVKFSRFVLGIISGRGFAQGVVHIPEFSPQDRAIIERIVKKAMSCVVLPQLQAGNIWSIKPDPTISQHIGILNRWAKAAHGRAAAITLEEAVAYDIQTEELPRVIYTPPAKCDCAYCSPSSRDCDAY